MDVIDHMMKLYEEGLDELMGAQKYAKCSHKAESQDDKMMYRNMAKQELDHAHNLIKSGDRMFAGADSMDSLKMVWASLRQHLMDWHADIEHKLG